MFVFERLSKEENEQQEHRAGILVRALKEQDVGTSVLVEWHKQYSQMGSYAQMHGIKIKRKKEGDKMRFTRTE